MGQIIGGAAKPKRCNLNKLSQLGTPAAGEYILVSSDNSMNAAGQGNFDCYIMGDGTKAATALELKNIMPLGVFDLSAYTGSTYVDLAAALNAMNALSAAYKKGGMSVKFVQSSDNKYVQARCMAQNFTTDVTQWQGVDDEPTAGSNNMVKSGGVANIVNAEGLKIDGISFPNVGRYINAVFDTTDNTWRTSDLICVVHGSSVKCHVYNWGNTSTNIISFFDKNKNYLSSIKGSSQTTLVEYTASVPTDAWYVAFTKNIHDSALSNASHYVITYQNISTSFLKNLIKALDDRVTADESLIASINNILELSFSYDISDGGGKFFNASGNIGNSGPYSISNVVSMKRGDVLSIATNIAAPSISIIVSCDSNGDNRTSLVVGNSTKSYSYTAAKDEYVRFCIYTTDYSVGMYRSNIISNIKSDISSLQSNVSVINNDLGITGSTITPVFTENSGHFITWNTGAIGNAAIYSYSSPILLNAGKKIKLNCTAAPVVSAITKCDSEGSNRVTIVKGTGDNSDKYSYANVSNEDIYVIVSYRNDKSCNVTISDCSAFDILEHEITSLEEHDGVIDNLLGISNESSTPTFTENTGKYIKFDDGSISPSGPYSYTSPILLGNGRKIVSTCTAINVVSAITKCDANGDNRVPLVQGLNDSANDYIYINVSGEDEYIILSFRNGLTHSAKIYNINVVETVNAQIDNINNEIDEINDKIDNADENIGFISVLDFCKFADTCICIGDSVTEGHIYDYPRTPTWGTVDHALSYPAALQKLTGWEVTNAGKAGYTATLWYYGSDAQHPAQVGLYDFSDYNICVVEFGYNAALTDTLDTDVDPYDNYEDFANTETGNYCRIIARALSQNPHIFIVINISPYLDKLSTRVGTSDVIKKIAAKYGLPVIDLGKNTLLNLNDNRFHGSTDGTDVNIIHMNAIGYFAKGTVVKKYLDKYFNEYASKYNLIKYE